MRPRTICVSLAVLVAIVPLFCTDGFASDRNSKSKSKTHKALPPGAAWVDTNKDGQVSDEEVQRAAQILKDKLKNAENNHSKESKNF